jgi:hypothetical protein
MVETRYKQCPECDADCESEDHDSEYSDAREEYESWWDFVCECGCEFTITDTEICRTTTETKITKEGNKIKK